MNKSQILDAFSNAAEKEEKETMQFLIEKIITNNLNKHEKVNIVLASIRKSKSLEMTKFILENLKMAADIVFVDAAIDSENVEILEFILDSNQMNSVKLLDFLNSAAYKGHLPSFKFIEERLNSIRERNNSQPYRLDCFEAAVRGGNLHVLKYLNKENDLQQLIAPRFVFLAADLGKMEILKYLVGELGISMDFEDDYSKKNCLMTAICRQDFEMVNYLIFYGANLNAFNSNGESPLLMASYFAIAHPEFVRVLVENGANVNVASKHGRTPLQIFANLDNLEMTKYIIEKGARVDQRNNDGETALFCACNFGYFNTAKFLIDNFADLNLPDSKGHTVLWVAAQYGSLEIVKELVSSKRLIDINKMDSKSQSPLMIATIRGHVNVVKCLVENGANPKLADSRGQDPILISLQRGQLEIIKYFVETKVLDLNYHNFNNSPSPMLISINSEQWEVVKYLCCEKGVAVSDPKALFKTLVEKKQFQILQELISMKLNDAKDLEFLRTQVKLPNTAKAKVFSKWLDQFLC